MRIGFLGLAAVVALLLGVFPGVVRAFDEPSVRTVRLAYFHGDVTIRRADSAGGDAAQLNMPLTEGVRISTGEDGEAEVEFEDGSLIRITPQSSVVLARLGTETDRGMDTQISLLNGLIYAELRAASRYAYRIDAAGDVVTPVSNVTLRIILDEPPAEVAVFDGTTRVERMGSQGGAGYQVEVAAGESLRGDTSAGTRYFLTPSIQSNSWDDWNEEREQAAANELAARTAARNAYAGDQGYGWSDLDASGTWYDTGQGLVWQPFDASASGFDPYGYGSWVYYTGPGYVWSSGYSWGWTPFRCGSWNYWQNFGWGWTPAGGCGYGGWAGYGPGRGGRVIRVNLSNLPPGYKRPLPPTPGGPIRVHPIVPVRSGPGPTRERVGAFEARQIAGQTAMPLRSVGGGYTSRGGSAVGSSLRRDFPVDRATRQPVLGTVSGPPTRRSVDAASRREGSEPPASAGTGLQGGEVYGVIGQPSGAARGEAARRAYPARGGMPVDRSIPTSQSQSQSQPVPPAGSSVPAPPPGAAGTAAWQGARIHPGSRGEEGSRPAPPARGDRSAPTSGVQPARAAPAPATALPAPAASAPAATAPPPVRFVAPPMSAPPAPRPAPPPMQAPPAAAPRSAPAPAAAPPAPSPAPKR